MLHKIRKNNEGFTIIEVLIVLAIAGLILLIVFLAVPALQRNSRNTQRRNDVSGVLGKLQEVSNNNNGRLCTPPGPCTVVPPLVVDKLGIYDTTSINYNVVATGAGAALPANVTAQQVIVRNNYKCNTAFVSTPVTSPAAISAGTTVTHVVLPTGAGGASTRSIVSIFAVESNGNNIQVQCVES